MGDTNERDSAPDAVRELRQGNVNKSVANLKRLFEKAQDNARASEPDEPPSTSNNKHRSETVAPGARKGAAGSSVNFKEIVQSFASLQQRGKQDGTATPNAVDGSFESNSRANSPMTRQKSFTFGTRNGLAKTPSGTPSNEASSPSAITNDTSIPAHKSSLPNMTQDFKRGSAPAMTVHQNQPKQADTVDVGGKSQSGRSFINQRATSIAAGSASAIQFAVSPDRKVPLFGAAAKAFSPKPTRTAPPPTQQGSASGRSSPAPVNNVSASSDSIPPPEQAAKEPEPKQEDVSASPVSDQTPLQVAEDAVTPAVVAQPEPAVVPPPVEAQPSVVTEPEPITTEPESAGGDSEVTTIHSSSAPSMSEEPKEPTTESTPDQKTTKKRRQSKILVLPAPGVGVGELDEDAEVTPTSSPSNKSTKKKKKKDNDGTKKSKKSNSKSEITTTDVAPSGDTSGGVPVKKRKAKPPASPISTPPVPPADSAVSLASESVSESSEPPVKSGSPSRAIRGSVEFRIPIGSITELQRQQSQPTAERKKKRKSILVVTGDDGTPESNINPLANSGGSATTPPSTASAGGSSKGKSEGGRVRTTRAKSTSLAKSDSPIPHPSTLKLEEKKSKTSRRTKDRRKMGRSLTAPLPKDDDLHAEENTMIRSAITPRAHRPVDDSDDDDDTDSSDSDASHPSGGNDSDGGKKARKSQANGTDSGGEITDFEPDGRIRIVKKKKKPRMSTSDLINRPMGDDDDDHPSPTNNAAENASSKQSSASPDATDDAKEAISALYSPHKKRRRHRPLSVHIDPFPTNVSVDIWNEPPTSDKNVLFESQEGMYSYSTSGEMARRGAQSMSIKAASLNKLVEFLTWPDYNEDDKVFQRIFLSTLDFFTSPQQLLVKLTQRFRVPSKPKGGDAAEWEMTVQAPIQSRVCSVIKYWIDNFSSLLDKDMAAAISKFIEGELNTKNHKPLIDILTRSLDERVKRDHALAERIRPPIDGGVDGSGRAPKTARGLPSHLRVTVEGDGISSSNNAGTGGLAKSNNSSTNAKRDVMRKSASESTLVFFKTQKICHPIELVSNDEAARQITIIDYRIWNAVKPWEICKLVWDDAKYNPTNSALKEMVARFNLISNFVIASILAQKGVKERARLVTKFIKIAKQLRQLNNFNSLMAICAGINHTCIARLTQTMNAVSRRDMKILIRLDRLMSVKKNWRRYRDALVEADGPCIPFLFVLANYPFFSLTLTLTLALARVFLQRRGLIVSDCVFVDNGNENTVGGLINFSKMKMLYFNCIEPMQTRQTRPYEFSTQNLQVEKMIQQQRILEPNEIYKRSLHLEPYSKVSAIPQTERLMLNVGMPTRSSANISTQGNTLTPNGSSNSLASTSSTTSASGTTSTNASASASASTSPSSAKPTPSGKRDKRKS